MTNYPANRLSPRQLTHDQESLIIDRYIKGEDSASEVADGLGTQWTQHDVYVAAQAIAARLGILRKRRVRSALELDWQYVHCLRQGGVPWKDVGYEVGHDSSKLKSLYHHHLSRGDIDAEQK